MAQSLANPRRLSIPQIGACLCLLVVAAWSYGPTLLMLVRSWNRHPDYSHGFMVIPLSAYILWLRRESRPLTVQRVGWESLSLLVLAVALRWIAALWHAEWMEGWSLVVWIAGSIWLVGGWSTFRWALPAVAFLMFMVPLPFRVETALALPLQSIATRMGSWSLQLLGQPAMAEGNTILLDDYRLEIERACSGLRVLMGVFALGVAYSFVARRTWWENVLILLAVVPIALVANTSRIVVAALMRQYAGDSVLADVGHIAGGWLMIVVAAVLFAVFLRYLRCLFYRADELDASALVAQQARPTAFHRDDLITTGETR